MGAVQLLLGGLGVAATVAGATGMVPEPIGKAVGGALSDAVNKALGPLTGAEEFYKAPPAEKFSWTMSPEGDVMWGRGTPRGKVPEDALKGSQEWLQKRADFKRKKEVREAEDRLAIREIDKRNFDAGQNRLERESAETRTQISADAGVRSTALNVEGQTKINDANLAFQRDKFGKELPLEVRRIGLSEKLGDASIETSRGQLALARDQMALQDNQFNQQLAQRRRQDAIQLIMGGITSLSGIR